MGESGSSLFNFDHKGIVRVPCKELLTSNTDPLELAIEVGAEDVTTDSADSYPGDEASQLDGVEQTKEFKDDECYQFKCEPRDLTLVSKAINDKSFTVVSTSLEYIPKRLVKLSPDMFNYAEKFMKLLGDRDDVMEVHDNYTLDEQVEK